MASSTLSGCAHNNNTQSSVLSGTGQKVCGTHGSIGCGGSLAVQMRFVQEYVSVVPTLPDTTWKVSDWEK
jgi:hypothetical protein